MTDINERRIRDTREALSLAEQARRLARRVEQYDRFAGSLLAGHAYRIEEWAEAHPYDEDGARIPGAPEVRP